MKKALCAFAVLVGLAMPAVIFGVRYASRVEDPVWSASPEALYLRQLERDILGGGLTRAEFIDRLREKSLLTGEAPLPLISFVNLYQLAEKGERQLLDPLFEFYRPDATAEEMRLLESLKK